MHVVTVEQMRAIEKETDALGITYAQMMENAGRSVAQVIQDWIDVSGRSVLALVGPGNNGGDALVAGRHLALAGAQVAFYLFKPRGQDDPNLALVLEKGLPVVLATDDETGQELERLALAADVVVDGLLGTGVNRPLQGGIKKVLQRCKQLVADNRRRRLEAHPRQVIPADASIWPEFLPLVVAVDCPSGLNCDTGEIDPSALPADLTVTLALPKVGHLRFPGAEAVGDLVVVDIGCPEGLDSLDTVELQVATAGEVRGLFSPTPLDAHKGTLGKTMIVAGSLNYTGAAALAAEGAYRIGAGLVTLAIPSAIHGALASILVEPTYVLLPHRSGAISEGAVEVLLDSLEGYGALLIGPGLGRDEKTGQFLKDLLNQERPAAKGRIGFALARDQQSAREKQVLPPLVVDADGLNLLSEMNDWQALLPPGAILTPHPGEMARLLQVNRDQVAEDRIGVAKRAAVEWGQTIVLKGAFTVVAGPDGRTTIIPYANPALATAGSGDVLAGAIAGLVAMGWEAFPAAEAGAYLHAAAGQRASDELGQRGVMAGDLPRYLATVLAEWGL